MCAINSAFQILYILFFAISMLYSALACMPCWQMDGEEQKCTNVISQSRRSGSIVKGSLGGGRYGRIWCKRIVEGVNLH